MSKELKKNVMELTLYFDFADLIATAQAEVSSTERIGYTYYKWSENTSQQMRLGVRLVPNIGSQAAGEVATNISNTTLKGHDEYGYLFSVGLFHELESSKAYAEKVEVHKGKVPEVLANRRNKKIESTKTYDVYTTPEKYTAAVLDAANKYFDTLIKIYRYHSE